MFAYLPSPENGVWKIGPLPLHAYGLMLALGVIVGVRIADPRAVRRGFAKGLIGELATKLVIGGIIGARVYHLFTGYKWSKGIVGAFKIWEGGLSIWGAVAGGAIALILVSRKRHLDTLLLCDALGPAVAVAQGIGRWGNYFNEELYGRPTTLPWGLKIHDIHNPNYPRGTLFHPTFLYESLWCFALFGLIVMLERRGKLRRGQSFWLYVALYTFERFFMELLRVDDATKIFGMRFNALLSAVLFFVGVGMFVKYGRRPVPAGGPTEMLLDGENGDHEVVAGDEPVAPDELQVSDTGSADDE